MHKSFAKPPPQVAFGCSSWSSNITVSHYHTRCHYCWVAEPLYEKLHVKRFALSEMSVNVSCAISEILYYFPSSVCPVFQLDYDSFTCHFCYKFMYWYFLSVYWPFMCCVMPVCVGARSKSRSRSPRHKLPLADDTPTPVAVADDTPTSQSATKTSFPASSKSIDHDTASFCARTAGNYRRSKRKSVKSATVLLTSKATHGRSFRKRTRSFVPIL